MLETDPIDLLLDADGDLVISGGDAAWSSGIAGVAQGIRIALQLFRGEWFLDLDEGVPYLERDGVSADEALLGQRFNEPKALRYFRDAIARAPGVNEIVSLSVTFDGPSRALTATWVVSTVFGDTPPDTLSLGV